MNIISESYDDYRVSTINKYKNKISNHITTNVLTDNLKFCVRFLENAYNYKVHHLPNGKNVFNKNDDEYLISIAKKIYEKKLNISNINRVTASEILRRVPKYGNVFVNVHLTRESGINFLYQIANVIMAKN